MSKSLASRDSHLPACEGVAEWVPRQSRPKPWSVPPPWPQPPGDGGLEPASVGNDQSRDMAAWWCRAPRHGASKGKLHHQGREEGGERGWLAEPCRLPG